MACCYGVGRSVYVEPVQEVKDCETEVAARGWNGVYVARGCGGTGCWLECKRMADI
jgi:hypothetical protein